MLLGKNFHVTMVYMKPDFRENVMLCVNLRDFEEKVPIIFNEVSRNVLKICDFFSQNFAQNWPTCSFGLRSNMSQQGTIVYTGAVV